MYQGKTDRCRCNVPNVGHWDRSWNPPLSATFIAPFVEKVGALFKSASTMEKRRRLKLSLLKKGIASSAVTRTTTKISGAAQDLGISRPTLYELMDKLGLRKSGETETP